MVKPNTIEIVKLSRGYTIFIQQRNTHGKVIQTWTVSAFKKIAEAEAYVEDHRDYLLSRQVEEHMIGIRTP